jgi:hypothetical protein
VSISDESRSKETIRDATSEQIKEADQRRKVRSGEPSKQTRTEESDQISSEGPRINTEVKTQSA